MITNKEQYKRETKNNLKDKLSDFISDEEGNMIPAGEEIVTNYHHYH